MGTDRGRKPLLRGRGVLLIEDFCRSTGLDLATVEELARTERLPGVLVSAEEPTRLMGILDDQLPSREALADMGLPVRADYNPESLRSVESPDDDPDDPDDPEDA